MSRHLNSGALSLRSALTKFFLAAFLLVSIVGPLLGMLMNLAGADVAGIVGSDKFRQSLANSALAAAVGTVISIVIAYLFALCVVRTTIRFREVFSVIVTLPMLIPSISHGMGLVILLGSNGVLTRFLGLGGTIYGFNGIVMGSVLYAFPVAFLMLADILKYEDGSPYEAAAVLGIPRRHQFYSITFPYLRKPLISVVFATFTLIFTDYGVPLMIGGRFTTLPALMYQEVIGLLNFSRGSVIGAFLLIPAVIAFVFDLAAKDRGNQNFVIQEKAKSKNRVRNGLAFGYCVLVCALVALPIVVFVILTFVARYPEDMSFSLTNIAKTMNMGAGRYLMNSFIIACGVSVLGTALSWLLAYFTARTPGKSSKALHLVYHLPGHTRTGPGAFLCALFQGILHLWHPVHAHSGEYRPLFSLPVSHGLQFPGQAQPEPGGCGPYPGGKQVSHTMGCAYPPDKNDHHRNDFLFFREFHDDHIGSLLSEHRSEQTRLPHDHPI
jgi:iron(III) transport system permease protein